MGYGKPAGLWYVGWDKVVCNLLRGRVGVFDVEMSE
jgi:hypothetical protein